MKPIDPKLLITSALNVIEIEVQAIQSLAQRIHENFIKACEYCLTCKGRIIVTGIGKSGHIARKISATLASTGTPAFFVHPAEANHGDMGMITANDVVIAISYSGHSQEILNLLPFIKRLDIPLISITGNINSELARIAHVNLDVKVEQEACPLGLAPTASTTATLVLGDALAVALLQQRGFTAKDFALSHPGGTLGRNLLLHVGDLMHGGEALPLVSPHTSLRDVLMVMTSKKLGLATIIAEDSTLLGIFTDGDLRRALERQTHLDTLIETIMTANCKTITAHTLASEALRIMETYKITALTVIDEVQHLIGIIHIHDIVTAGVTYVKG